MDVKAYIESGILELYVVGQLSDDENQEVYELTQKHPELLEEVIAIETALSKLSESLAPLTSDFSAIKNKIDTAKVIEIKPKANTNWITYSGWAASVVLAGGLLWTLNTKNTLEQNIQVVSNEKQNLELEIQDARNNLANTKNLLNTIRAKDILTVPLGGQGDYENTYAKVYWNKGDNTIYLDAQGLPDAPEGKVWQVWSLTLNPLMPTSLGTIADFNTDDNKIFAISNENESQAFGITLEPEGGSESPTMEQLYTLGVVNAAP